MSTMQDTKEIELWERYTASGGMHATTVTPRSHRRKEAPTSFLRRVIGIAVILAVAATGLNASIVHRDKPTVPSMSIRWVQPESLAEPFALAPPIKDTNPGGFEPHGASDRAGRDAAKRVPPPVVVPPAVSQIEKVIAYALAQQGKPYRWAAAGPNAFDCSGLVLAAFRQIGISLPHYTGTMISHGQKISRANMQRGDIIFPTSGHVAIYLGNNMMVAASSSAHKIRVQKVYAFYAARRLI